MEWWNRLPRNTKIIVGVGGAAGLFLVYRWWKGKQAAASSSSSSSPSTLTVGTTTAGNGSSSGTPPTVNVSTPQGSYTGPPQDLGGVLGILSGSSGSGAATSPTTTPTPAPTTAAPTTPNLPPTTTINGQQYYVLGQVGQPAQGGGYNYSGYNVGGGSQVFFGNQNAVAQGSQAVKPGSFAYTPVGNAGLISAQPVSTEVIP